MKAYIHAIASITHQPSFHSENVYATLEKLGAESELISPDYKDYIQPAALRRLSPVLRIGLAASIDCEQQAGKSFDAISVGTALGCLRDTEKFLVTIHTTTSDFLSPTAFIQSTHNTIGGQISLGLNNHAYNMTHTQNNLSFEVALLDGLLCLREGKENVLVGAADEKIDFLENFRPGLIPEGRPLSSGGTFMALQPTTSDKGILIRAVRTNFNSKDTQRELEQFLSDEGVQAGELDFIATSEDLKISGNDECVSIDFLDYTGLHYSASAFAVHIAHDYLNASGKRYALVVNGLCHGRLGLTLLERT